MLLKIFLIIYLILFFGIAFFWRSYKTWQATGVNPYRLASRGYQQDDIHGLMSRQLRLISAGTVGVVLIYAFAGGVYGYLDPIAWLQTPPIMAIGLVMLLVSLVWVMVAQSQMGDSWRIGIDNDSKTALVTQGVFGLSRNPIFLGMRVNLAGLFLVLPNAFTLLLWVLGDVIIRAQVYLEEEYLLQSHGQVYEQYRQQVRRWL
jgi:protein-S-isoprenylcysteine O-methyltransferase Ste14